MVPWPFKSVSIPVSLSPDSPIMIKFGIDRTAESGHNLAHVDLCLCQFNSGRAPNTQETGSGVYIYIYLFICV